MISDSEDLVNLLTPFGEIRSLRIVEKNNKLIGFVVYKDKSSVKKLFGERKVLLYKNGLKYAVMSRLT